MCEVWQFCLFIRIYLYSFDEYATKCGLILGLVLSLLHSMHWLGGNQQFVLEVCIQIAPTVCVCVHPPWLECNHSSYSVLPSAPQSVSFPATFMTLISTYHTCSHNSNMPHNSTMPHNSALPHNSTMPLNPIKCLPWSRLNTLTVNRR